MRGGGRVLVGLSLVVEGGVGGERERKRGGREGRRREDDTEGTVDLDALDTVFLSISWNRHVR